MPGTRPGPARSTDIAFGGLAREDHPVASLPGVGVAVRLGVPVTVETAVADDDRADHLVTCRWDAD